jgi:LysM repeat protein
MLLKNNLCKKHIGILVSVFWFLAGCTSSQPDPRELVSITADLTPYSSPTATQTAEVTSAILITPTVAPSATPTPMLYTIVQGDTMLAIAIRHGISLEQLQAANPDVNPRLLVVGNELVIPRGENLPSSPATATPIPIETNRTNCYSVPDGVWCYLSIINDRSRALENLSAQVLLYDGSGEPLGGEIAIGALNLLPPGEELPLVAFLPGHFPSEFSVATTILTVQPVPRNDERYLNAWVEVDQVILSEDGLRAEINGKYGLPQKSPPGNDTWLLGIAYDALGNVIGLRKTERSGLVEPGTNQEFSQEVFSLGPEIDQVRIYVEMRP